MEKESDRGERRKGGDRYVVSLPIRVEWDDVESGSRIVEEGMTENIGPGGTLIHLPRQLPRVGSRVELSVFISPDAAPIAKTKAEVLRLERNAGHPLAALRILEKQDAWLKNVYENDEVKLLAVGTPDEYEE